MPRTKYDGDSIKDFFRKNKVATLDQLSQMFGKPAQCTIFRKLDELGYLSSYSHRGKYYTLRSVPRFNRQGLWNWRHVYFSRFGNLLKTASAFVCQSNSGYSARELHSVLRVKTKHALVQLVRQEQLTRKKMGGKYIYLSTDRKKAYKQQEAREAQRPTQAIWSVSNANLAVEEAKAVVLLFLSLLDENQRRLYAGLESLKLGHGGDAYVAGLLGMDPHTVARGRQELETHDVLTDSQRPPGGGRKSVEKKRPES